MADDVKANNLAHGRRGAADNDVRLSTRRRARLEAAQLLPVRGRRNGVLYSRVISPPTLHGRRLKFETIMGIWIESHLLSIIETRRFQRRVNLMSVIRETATDFPFFFIPQS